MRRRVDANFLGVDAILKGLPIYMLVGIAVVVVVSQVHRVAGAALGVAFWIATGILGSLAYDRGNAIGLPGLPFSRTVFFVVCVAFAGIHLYSAFAAHRRKQRQALRKKLLDDA